jgi:hypothetical protein
MELFMHMKKKEESASRSFHFVSSDEWKIVVDFGFFSLQSLSKKPKAYWISIFEHNLIFEKKVDFFTP